MRVIIFVTAAASLIGGTAFAAQTTGTIVNISKKADTITLASGKTFHLPEGIEVESLKKGERISVTYNVEARNRRQVTKVQPTH